MPFSAANHDAVVTRKQQQQHTVVRHLIAAGRILLRRQDRTICVEEEDVGLLRSWRIACLCCYTCCSD